MLGAVQTTGTRTSPSCINERLQDMVAQQEKGAVAVRIYIAAGLIAAVGILLGTVALTPKSYTSSSYLKLDGDAVAKADVLMRSGPVLDQVIAKVKIEGATPEERRRRLSGKRTFRHVGGELAQLDIKDKSPATAQSINRAFLDVWLETTKPKAVAKARISEQLQRAKQEFSWAQKSLEKLDMNPDAYIIDKKTNVDIKPEAVASLLRLYKDLGERIDNLSLEASGLPAETIVGEPSLPEEPNGTLLSRLWR